MDKLSKRCQIQKSSQKTQIKKPRTQKKFPLAISITNSENTSNIENASSEMKSKRVVHRRTHSNVPIVTLEACGPEVPMKKTHRRTNSEITTAPSEKRKLVSQIKSSFVTSAAPPLTTLDFYKIGRPLGTGAFGKVHLGQHVLTGLKVAIKIIEKNQLKGDRARSKVFQEIFVMNRLRHPNISQLLEAFETSESIFLIMEYVGGGDLLSLLKKKGSLAENEAKEIFVQIAEAVKTCHSRNIVHRDVKLDNVLLSSDHSEVKICDFGVSRMMVPGEKAEEQCGTPAYLAPEIIINKGYHPFCVDIWSMGVLLYALVTGTMPFKASTIEELHQLILKCKFTIPDYLSNECKDLIQRMICKTPHLRISVEQILSHPWLSNLLKTKTSRGNADSKETEIMNQVMEIGFTEESIIKSLRFKEINHATATYHLLKLYYKNKLHFL